MPYDRLTISCDSHILEVPEIFEGLEARFGDAAPGIYHDPEKGEMLSLGSGKTFFISVGRFGIAGHFANDPETQEMIKQGYSALRPGAIDPLERIKDQDLDGVDAEVLLPSVLLGLNVIEDGDIVAATYKNYNDWVYNYASQSPKRLFPTACIPMHDPDLAAEELRRAVAMGHVGANIPCVQPDDLPYSDRRFDRFWAVAEELGTPLVMHFLTSAKPNHGMPDMGPVMNYSLAAFSIQRSIGEIICSGVCARFPGLKFVPTEWETGWVAHYIERMDWGVHRVPRERLPAELTESFSHYFRNNFVMTFEDDRIGLETRYDIGVKNLMWGSDFPHHDSTFPHSRAVLDEIFDGVPDNERYLITAGNCRDIYHLPFED
jgi:predicted TIM-barrel fold metal-dependent hydrolase